MKPTTKPTAAATAIMASVVVLSAVGCAKALEVSEEAAQVSAEQFIREHVKFFSRNGSSTVDLPEYRFERTMSTEEKGFFAIAMHVTAVLGNDTRENDLFVKVDKKSGKVVEFNGQRLPS